MNNATANTVFVGMSGGVDSSVAAFRLQQQGYNVVGVFIKVWHPDWLQCNWEQERLDAMRVAAHLEIPFLTCDAESAYKQEVADYFIREYEAGRTPNPDVMCNKAVKFGAFLRFAQQRGATHIATGHYAQRAAAADGHDLLRGVDKNKDQSYFLWTLTPEQLSHVLLPVGDTPKEQIRQEAEAAGLPTAQKKDSQGICFLGHIDIKEFLGHYITLTPGDVLDETGAVIGRHDGALVYTLGQRHGFTLHTPDANRVPMYVVSRDITHNTITVSHQPPHSTSTALSLEECNWINQSPVVGETYAAQARYRQTPFYVTVTDRAGASITLTREAETDAFAIGQSCVLYEGDICLGGGIISA